jgi:DNA replication protein DnaC
MTRAPIDPSKVGEQIATLLSSFRVPTMARELVPRLIAAGHADALPLIQEVIELEAADRLERRVDRLRRASNLPPGKTFETLDESRLPRPLAQRLHELAKGAFLEEATNVLAFGLPGVGKSHAACAMGHALVEASHSVLFVPTYQIVQDLLAAKRDLQLPRALRKLDVFELLILDDIGYVQQTPDEAEILFTLMAERYERRSMLITSNLVFSDWSRIFKDPMTTAAAIDRLVHHSVILEFAVSSYRTEAALKRGSSKATDDRSNGPEATS